MTADTVTPVLVVTGAGSGIGRAVAEALDGRPETLVLAGRRRPPLEKAAAGPHSASVLADTALSTPEGARRLADIVGERPVVGLALVAGGGGASSARPGPAGGAESWADSWRAEV